MKRECYSACIFLDNHKIAEFVSTNLTDVTRQEKEFMDFNKGKILGKLSSIIEETTDKYIDNDNEDD